MTYPQVFYRAGGYPTHVDGSLTRLAEQLDDEFENEDDGALRSLDYGEIHLRPAGGVLIRNGEIVAGEYRPGAISTAPAPAARKAPAAPPAVRYAPTVTGLVLRWGEYAEFADGRAAGYKGTQAPGKVSELFRSAAAIDADSSPPLVLNHQDKHDKDRSGPVIGEFVCATPDSHGMWMTWRVTSESDVVKRELARTSFPLSISFRELDRPVELATTLPGHRIVEQRAVRISHVAVVSRPAYKSARLNRLATV